MSVHKNHRIYVLKIKVSELEFEVIPIIQNSLSQTHDELESFSTLAYNSDDLHICIWKIKLDYYVAIAK